MNTENLADKPAFPCNMPEVYQGNNCIGHYSGITVRHYFAAKAMQALIQRVSANPDAAASMAKLSLQFADALLAELGAK